MNARTPNQKIKEGSINWNQFQKSPQIHVT
jgi:ABC-type metal ion transport system substrate-binding protein